MADFNELLKELNPAQLQAVQHPPQIPLQILAGPGSGKTKVLTMRIAHLITNCYLPPWAICAVTFTNKAANEMRERLVKLIGKDKTAQIRMGTFHALCCMFLRRYAKYVGIEGNFTVCDADESKKIIGKLLKPYKAFLQDKNLTLQEGTVMSAISKCKATGMTADAAIAKLAENDARIAKLTKKVLAGKRHTADELKQLEGIAKNSLLQGDLGRVITAIYKEYEKTLRGSNSLDFDDLLVFGVKLFSNHKKASSWCQHVLVDEYQDTNTTQYELMRYIAQTCRCVTIVGDPDQSIYGWRSAEIENLANMKQDFPTTQQIYLEHNYRSTAAILAASMAIITQDKKRIQKTLNTSHPKGPTPVLRAFPIEQVEAGFIAAEIKRLVAFSGGMLNWSDFVVLLRFNALSRTIESALQKEGIPNRVLAGHKFFERMEVKDVLAYLQLVDNPAFVPAFTRVVNVPSRTVGEKTVSELLHRAEQLKISPMLVVERIVAGEIPDIKPPVKKKLASFVGTIRDLRKFAAEGMSPSKLITALLDLIHYGEHLRKTQEDFESRWDNVQELINFASEVENNMPAQLAEKMNDAEGAAHEEIWGDDLGEWDADQIEDGVASGTQTGDTPLRLFLQASMLSTDTETKEDEKSKEKVTIATCHAAKGLEWAVVMIPAVVGGVFPSARAEDIDEELRLLYVACTRAQGLLYLTHTTTRMVAGESKPQELSGFIAAVRSDAKTQGLFSEELSPLALQDRVTLSKVLNRPLPDEAEVKRRVTEFEQTGRHPIWGANAPFRDVPNGGVNGYAVPIRYHGVPEQQQPLQHQPSQRQPPQAGGAGQRQQQQQPPPHWPSQHDRDIKPHIKHEPVDIDEPPVFVASSLLHFNNTHRSPGVKNSFKPPPMVASGSRLPPPRAVPTANIAAPLVSSSSRVVNVPVKPEPSDTSSVRNWIVQSGRSRDAGKDDLSKAKGKGKEVAVPEQRAMVSPIKAEPTQVKVEAFSRPAAHVNHSRPAIGAQPGPARVKKEPALPPVQSSGPRLESAAIPTSVKEEPVMPSTFPAAPPASIKREAVVPRLTPVSSPSEARPTSSGASVPSSSSSGSGVSESSPSGALSAETTVAAKQAATTGVKRRLGMGRATGGYANKKFKPMVPNGS